MIFNVFLFSLKGYSETLSASLLTSKPMEWITAKYFEVILLFVLEIFNLWNFYRLLYFYF